LLWFDENSILPLNDGKAGLSQQPNDPSKSTKESAVEGRRV